MHLVYTKLFDICMSFINLLNSMGQVQTLLNPSIEYEKENGAKQVVLARQVRIFRVNYRDIWCINTFT